MQRPAVICFWISERNTSHYKGIEEWSISRWPKKTHLPDWPATHGNNSFSLNRNRFSYLKHDRPPHRKWNPVPRYFSKANWSRQITSHRESLYIVGYAQDSLWIVAGQSYASFMYCITDLIEFDSPWIPFGYWVCENIIPVKAYSGSRFDDNRRSILKVPVHKPAIWNSFALKNRHRLDMQVATHKGGICGLPH